MITVRFQGGLGNQMFQYALYYQFQKQGKDVQADLFYYDITPDAMPFVLTDVFQNIELQCSIEKGLHNKVMRNPNRRLSLKIIDLLQYKMCLDKCQYIYEMEEGYYCKYIKSVKNGYIEGFWQTEKYFEDNRNDIKRIFTFRNVDNDTLNYYLELIKSTNSVSLHIRRGDYLIDVNSKIFGGICNKEYYQAAMDYMNQKLDNPHYFVFSDDIEWAKRYVSVQNVTYVDIYNIHGYEDWYDMYLMSKCKHNIIANSSFSWWGAWLNQNEDKIVLTPRKWINGKKTPDIWARYWIKIEG